jgi:flagellar biosynthesis/type III secretory pathway protein FliH
MWPKGRKGGRKENRILRKGKRTDIKEGREERGIFRKEGKNGGIQEGRKEGRKEGREETGLRLAAGTLRLLQ